MGRVGLAEPKPGQGGPHPEQISQRHGHGLLRFSPGRRGWGPAPSSRSPLVPSLSRCAALAVSAALACVLCAGPAAAQEAPPPDPGAWQRLIEELARSTQALVDRTIKRAQEELRRAEENKRRADAAIEAAGGTVAKPGEGGGEPPAPGATTPPPAAG